LKTWVCVGIYSLNSVHAHLNSVITSQNGLNTGLLKMIVGVLTTCHTQYTCDGSM